MTDHDIGLVGIALGILSLITQYRWDRVPKWITDIGLIVATILGTIAFGPQIRALVPVPAPQSQSSPLPQAAPRITPAQLKATPARTAADQKEIDSLQSELAATKDQLEKTMKRLDDANNEAHVPFTCLSGDRLAYIFNLARRENSANAEATIKQAADALDICNGVSRQSRNELVDSLKQSSTRDNKN